ncbi:hypothetical protein [Pseudomonas sp. Sample_21]|uniref:hypothetical protein n=1 Tax=Pseudomonas sp. Sample_21 TaxID=2448265 RepID=UPI001032474E|nr:hypothetical protein [Pseudomonas sp. Sample_21]
MNNGDFGVRPLKWLALVLAILACAFYAVYLGHAILSDRVLYADGSNFFVQLLSQNKAWPIADDPKHIRLFANIVNQLPVAIAIKLGMESVSGLRFLFGAGAFLGTALVYFFCFFLSRRANDSRVFFFALASLITCAIPSDIFILNQSFISLAFAWVLIHYLLLKINIRWFDWLVIAVVSLILFRGHENLVLWGCVIFVGALAAVWFSGARGDFRKSPHLYVIGAVGVAQSLFVLYWQFTHPVGQETNAFLELVKFAMPQEMWVGNTRVSLLATVLLVVAVLYGWFARSIGKGGALLFVLVFLIFLSLSGVALHAGVLAIQDFNLTDPRREFNYRFLMTIGSPGWMLASILFVCAKIDVDVRGAYFAIIALSVGLISASLWQVSNTLQWLEFKNAALHELNEAPGPILQPDSVRERLSSEQREYAYKYRWVWTWPVFGMSLQNDGRVVKMFRPEGFDDYFKPPKKIPFVPLSGGEYGSEGQGLYSFDGFQAAGKKQ